MASQIALENQHICHFMPRARVANNGAIWTGHPHSDHIALRGAQRAVFLIILNASGGAAGNATVWCAGCFTSAGGCTTQKVSFRYRIITTSDTQGTIYEAYSVSFGATSDRILEIEVDAATLAEVSTGGWEYVQLLTSNFSATVVGQGAYVAILQGLRHKRNVLGTQMT
jgi:hypothetical protein